MSNIFNLSNIFTESSFPIALRNVTSGEVYRLSVLNVLNGLNESYNHSTAKLYKAINEAETKEEENTIFNQYFIEIEKSFGSVIKQLDEMQSRFVINVDNIVDANMDILNNTSLMSECKPFHFTFRKFKNINNADFPRVNPIGLYRKEFDFIGQLLQDLGPAASNQSKLQVIATVYNNLNKGKDIDLTRKCIADILGEDEDDDDCDISEFPKELYEKFQEENTEDKVIDKALLFNLQLSMKNYKSVVAATLATGDSLMKQLIEIKEDLKSFITNGDKNTYSVNTPTDGIRNTSYKLDTYTMNQLDLFMKTKINQLIQMANIYRIAFSVKLDATIQYYNQCKEILRMADMQCAGVPDSKEDDTVDGGDISDDDNEPEIPEGGEDPDEPANEPDEDPVDPTPNGDEGESGEDPEVPDDGEGSGTPEPKAEGSDDSFEMEPGPDMNDLDAELAKFEEQCILYEYQLFALNNQYQRLSMIQEAQQYVTEFDAGKIDGAVKGKGTGIGGTLKAVAGKIKQIIEKLKQLIQGFMDKVLAPSGLKLKRLAEQEEFINTKRIDHVREDGGAIMPKIYTDQLKKFELPNMPAKGSAQFNELTNTSEYFKKAFSPRAIVHNGGEKADIKIKESVIQSVIESIEVDGIKNTNELDPMALYNWCRNDYNNAFNDVEKQLKSIMQEASKTEKDAESESPTPQNASAIMMARSYFNEKEETNTDSENKDQSKDQSDSGNDSSVKVTDAGSENGASYTVYFDVCSKVLQGRAVAVQRVFNEYTAYLLWHINYRRTEKGLPTVSWYSGDEEQQAAAQKKEGK